jgi:hypothetical protein
VPALGVKARKLVLDALVSAFLFQNSSVGRLAASASRAARAM